MTSSFSKSSIKKTSSLQKRRITTASSLQSAKPQASSTNLKAEFEDELEEFKIDVNEKLIEGYLDEKTSMNTIRPNKFDDKVTKKRVSFLEKDQDMSKEKTKQKSPEKPKEKSSCELSKEKSKGKFKEKSNEECLKKDLPIPMISSKNQEIIKSILDKKSKKIPDQSSTKVEEILSKPSLKLKYEELIQENTDFPLPIAYKSLLSLFSSLDETLNYLKMRGQPQFFDEIQENFKLIGKFIYFPLKIVI